jgi:hypothetical protein
MIVMANERINLLATSTSSRDDLNYSRNILVIMHDAICWLLRRIADAAYTDQGLICEVLWPIYEVGLPTKWAACASSLRNIGSGCTAHLKNIMQNDKYTPRPTTRPVTPVWPAGGSVGGARRWWEVVAATRGGSGTSPSGGLMRTTAINHERGRRVACCRRQTRRRAAARESGWKTTSPDSGRPQRGSARSRRT